MSVSIRRRAPGRRERVADAVEQGFEPVVLYGPRFPELCSAAVAAYVRCPRCGAVYSWRSVAARSDHLRRHAQADRERAES